MLHQLSWQIKKCRGHVGPVPINYELAVTASRLSGGIALDDDVSRILRTRPRRGICCCGQSIANARWRCRGGADVRHAPEVDVQFW